MKMYKNKTKATKYDRRKKSLLLHSYAMYGKKNLFVLGKRKKEEENFIYTHNLLYAVMANHIFCSFQHRCVHWNKNVIIVTAVT